MKAKVPGILRRPAAAQAGRDRQARPRRASPFTGRIINDAKVSDHHAIIPTGKRPGDAAAGGRRRSSTPSSPA